MNAADSNSSQDTGTLLFAAHGRVCKETFDDNNIVYMSGGEQRVVPFSFLQNVCGASYKAITSGGRIDSSDVYDLALENDVPDIGLEVMQSRRLIFLVNSSGGYVDAERVLTAMQRRVRRLNGEVCCIAGTYASSSGALLFESATAVHALPHSRFAFHAGYSEIAPSYNIGNSEDQVVTSWKKNKRTLQNLGLEGTDIMRQATEIAQYDEGFREAMLDFTGRELQEAGTDANIIGDVSNVRDHLSHLLGRPEDGSKAANIIDNFVRALELEDILQRQFNVRTQWRMDPDCGEEIVIDERNIWDDINRAISYLKSEGIHYIIE